MRTINLYDPEMRRDPYPVFAELRRDSPVCKVEPGGLLAVARAADVVFVLKNHKLFSSEGNRRLSRPDWVKRAPLPDSIVLSDPPGHTRLRGLATHAFSPRSVARLEGRARAIAEELAARFDGGDEIDFVSGLAMPLPARVICEVLGLDPTLHASFRRWALALSSLAPTPPDSAERIAQIRHDIAEMESYLREVIEARVRQPGDDFTSDLLRAEVDGERLTYDEVLAFLGLMLPAGYETTSNLLSHGLLALMDHPELAARLRADPSRIPSFVEEALRYGSPVQAIMRLVTADVEIAGVKVPAGSLLLPLLGSANRDEAQYKEPDRFDIDRKDASSVALGHGIHFCLGAPLARLEARVAFEVLLARFDSFSRRAEPIDWSHSLIVRAPSTLPVRFSRARSSL